MRCKRPQYQKYAQDVGFAAPGGVLSRFGRGDTVDGCQLAAAQPGQQAEDVNGRGKHLEELAKSTTTLEMSQTGLGALCLNC